MTKNGSPDDLFICRFSLWTYSYAGGNIKTQNMHHIQIKIKGRKFKITRRWWVRERNYRPAFCMRFVLLSSFFCFFRSLRGIGSDRRSTGQLCISRVGGKSVQEPEINWMIIEPMKCTPELASTIKRNKSRHECVHMFAGTLPDTCDFFPQKFSSLI